jgi:hypothetical protein
MFILSLLMLMLLPLMFRATRHADAMILFATPPLMPLFRCFRHYCHTATITPP